MNEDNPMLTKYYYVFRPEVVETKDTEMRSTELKITGANQNISQLKSLNMTLLSS